jgi:hypothetical protein
VDQEQRFLRRAVREPLGASSEQAQETVLQLHIVSMSGIPIDEVSVFADGEDSVTLRAYVTGSGRDFDAAAATGAIRFSVSGPEAGWVKLEESAVNQSGKEVKIVATSPPGTAGDDNEESKNGAASLDASVTYKGASSEAKVKLFLLADEFNLEIGFSDA